jgi:DNA-binding XRE family transcriptional regulator
MNTVSARADSTVGQTFMPQVRVRYIVSDMNDDDLPVFPGFRELAQRRRELLGELAAQRRAAGLSQAEVAERMGTSQPAIARLEAGEVDVRMSTVERYAAAIGRRLELRVAPYEEPGRRP